MTPPPGPLPAIISDLGFTPVTADTAIGEVAAVPCALTLLSDDTPGLLLQWRCRTEAVDAGAFDALTAGLSESQARLSVEHGAVWLSLYDVTGQSAESLQQLLAHVAGMIQSGPGALAAGCLRCGTVDAALLAAEGRPTRLCTDCLAAAIEQRHAAESQLNAPSAAATLGLPAAVAVASAGWALFWTAIDFVLDWAGIQVIELHEFAVLLMVTLIGGAGYLLGRPLGVAVRRSIGLRHAPVGSALLVVAIAVIAGETLYLAVFFLRRVGVFDLAAAAQVVGVMVANYTPFWIICKLLVAAAIGVCCAVSAGERRSAPLEV